LQVCSPGFIFTWSVFAWSVFAWITAGFPPASQISTATVDKVVDKLDLTGRSASIGAGFNKLPNPKAIFLPFKINYLQNTANANNLNFCFFLEIF
jgi:hypothetical protein